jgi:ADP-ribosylglycohydrolase
MNPTTWVLGAAAGDIIGSRFEGQPHKSETFELFEPSSRFTDDTVLTIAVADAILRQEEYGPLILEYARRYPRTGYGGFFRKWMCSYDPQPITALEMDRPCGSARLVGLLVRSKMC